MGDAAQIEIPNYRLVKRVGRGGFGEVWLAEEVLTRIYRAVKIIPGQRAKHTESELDGVRQYQQRTHGHPHLVQILTVGKTADAGLYYVMEAADNALGSRAASPEDYEAQTLATVLERDGRLPLDRALDYAAAILEGVEHLHRHGLAHRDLKPQNMLFVDGVLKLADVGLASRDASAAGGTPGYRTPEGTPDDLYAIGVMLYQMITGQPPSSFPELPADLDRTHDPRRLKDALRLINQACHPEAEQRLASPVEFLDAVTGARGTGRGRVRGRNVGFIAAAAVVALLVLVWLTRGGQSVPEWKDFEFRVEPASMEWQTFPKAGDGQPSRFRLTYGVSNLRELKVTLSAEFDIGFPHDGAIMVLMLAVDDQIVHLVYYDKPGGQVARREFEDRDFRLRNELLERLASGAPAPVYVVLAATDDFFAFCDEYAREPDKRSRILIGHIQRRPAR